MDRKSFMIVAAAVVMLLLLSPVVDHFFPAKPMPATPPGETNVQTSNVAAAAPGSNATEAAPATRTATAQVAPALPEHTLTVTNDDLVFVFTSHGGGLKTVALKKYRAIISRTGGAAEFTNMATLNDKAQDPILALQGNELQGDNEYTLTQNGPVVRAEKTMTNGLRVVKEFNISTNYLFTARVLLTNTSEQKLDVPWRQVVVGTTTPIGPLDDPNTQGTFWYDGRAAQSVNPAWFANRTLGCIPGTPRALYDEGAGNVVWAAVHNQFFTIAAIPTNPAPRIIVRPVTLPPPEMLGLTNIGSALLTNGMEAAISYPPVALAPHQAIENQFTFYTGPKEYNRLAEYNLKRIMDFGRYTGFFSEALLTAMNVLHGIGLGYGWTIIVITLVIKALFWPLTRASTRSQKRMQLLQPQLKAIADKYADDPAKKNQKTMEFMKEHKVSPLGSCLPMVIQIPVFFGFYWMLRNAIELRGVPFLWAHDLSQPDTVKYIGDFPINPLPLIMGATQLWQSHLLPASPGMDPGQQKMMRYMPLLFVAICYKMSAGLTLYWTISNLLTILQTKITRMTDAPAAAPAGIVPKKKT